MPKRSLFEELERRNVIRVAIAYLAGSWLLIQIADTVLPRLGSSDQAITNVIIVLAIGFLPALILAWVFQWTPQGIRRDTDTQTPTNNRSFDRIIMTTLALALGYFAADKFLLDPARDAQQIHVARQEGRADAFVEEYGDNSIVVLPFVNMSSDPEQEYFSDGIAEELLNLLAQIPDLRVISRSTAFTFKGVDIVVPDIARKLNVAHVLEGSVRKFGNKIRITAQLIDGRSDTHLWSQTYDRELEDIFVIQDEISAMVVAELKLKLLGDAPKAQQTDPRAYDLYLRGRYLLHSEGGVENNSSAAEYLEKAVELEPDWTPAIAELMRAYSRLHTALPDQRDDYEERLWALQQRLEQADEVGDRAFGWKGWLAWQLEDDPQLAARYFERAAAINPAQVDLLRAESALFIELGRYDEAIAVTEYLVVNDPSCSNCLHNLSFSLRATGRPREAAERLESILQWQVPGKGLLWSLGLTWLAAGEPEKALTYFEEFNPAPNENMGLLLALHDLGRQEEFEKDFANYRDADEPDPEGIARVYAWTGSRDEAFRWLDNTVEKYGPESAGWVKTDTYSKIMDDPRWQSFLERNGQAGENLTEIEFDPKLPESVRAKLNEASEKK